MAKKSRRNERMQRDEISRDGNKKSAHPSVENVKPPRTNNVSPIKQMEFVYNKGLVRWPYIKETEMLSPKYMRITGEIYLHKSFFPSLVTSKFEKVFTWICKIQEVDHLAYRRQFVCAALLENWQWYVDVHSAGDTENPRTYSIPECKLSFQRAVDSKKYVLTISNSFGILLGQTTLEPYYPVYLRG